MNPSRELTALQRREKVRMRFGSFGALARKLRMSDSAVTYGLDNGRTTLVRFQQCMAGIGITLQLVEPGYGLRGRPICRSRRATEVSQGRRSDG